MTTRSFIRTRVRIDEATGSVLVLSPQTTRVFACPLDGGEVYEILANGLRRPARKGLHSSGPTITCPHRRQLREIIRRELNRAMADARYLAGKKASFESLGAPDWAYYKVELEDGTWCWARNAICIKRRMAKTMQPKKSTVFD